MSSSSRSAGIGITLGMTADPATAAAAYLALLPERDSARRIASPTASTSTMFFSTTALGGSGRSEEHTSELQSRENLVCRLLLEKKKKDKNWIQMINNRYLFK